MIPPGVLDPPDAKPTGEPLGWAAILPHWRLAVLDLRRLYGVDLTDPAVSTGPWSRVRPFLLGLPHERDSLVARALRG